MQLNTIVKASMRFCLTASEDFRNVPTSGFIPQNKPSNSSPQPLTMQLYTKYNISPDKW